MCGALAARKPCSRGVGKRGKVAVGGGERTRRSLKLRARGWEYSRRCTPSPKTRWPRPDPPRSRRAAPRAAAAPSSASSRHSATQFSVISTWALDSSRGLHIGSSLVTILLGPCAAVRCAAGSSTAGPRGAHRSQCWHGWVYCNCVICACAAYAQCHEALGTSYPAWYRSASGTADYSCRG